MFIRENITIFCFESSIFELIEKSIYHNVYQDKAGLNKSFFYKTSISN